jgi:hypothetical protein
MQPFIGGINALAEDCGKLVDATFTRIDGIEKTPLVRG